MIEAHYIVSSGRAGLISPAHKRCTYYRLPLRERARAVYVVSPQENAGYRARGVPTLPILSGCRNLAEAQQRTFEYARQAGQRVISILDDDVGWIRSYLERQANGSWKHTPKDAELCAMWDSVVSDGERIANCATVGFDDGHVKCKPPRPGRPWPNYYVPYRQMGAFVVWVDRVPLDVRWDLMPLSSDFCFTLQLLERGLTNAVHRYYRFETSNYAEGGSSEYKTIARHNAVMEELIARWPRWVRKSSVSRMRRPVLEGERTKVTISWRRMALCYGGIDQ